MTSQAFITAIMLARVCVSEGGWNGHDECTVIVHALYEQARDRGVPIRRQICAYAPKSCNKNRVRRRWIAHLHPERRAAPPGWPRLSWEKYRPRFAAMVVTAYRASIGEIPSACPAALHWGAKWCRACKRRMRRGFELMECPIALNAWYRRRVYGEN